MKPPSIWAHIRDIIFLPVVVAGIVPYLVYRSGPVIISHLIIIRISGMLVFLAGISLLSYTIYLFRIKGFGTLAPWSPPKKLVVSGPYKYCRNPMITGVLFTVMGEGLFFWSVSIVLYALFVFMVNTAYFYFSEEPGLVRRFGEDYVRYKQYVPRWIPRLHAYQPD